jgi:hypothetical protein
MVPVELSACQSANRLLNRGFLNRGNAVASDPKLTRLA